MEPEQDRAELVARTRETLGAHYEQLRWITADQAHAATDRRAELLARLDRNCAIDCRGTKPHRGPLAPGCGCCTRGEWSCLFVCGKCNADCAYCPAPQETVGEPQTNAVRFARPDEYARYLERFGFGGASLSGGEPLLTVDRTLAFLRAVRRHRGPGFHLWLYTNGTLLEPALLDRLRAAGLDELRINIGAVGYDLAPVRLAARHLECVTVEIPALPERAELLWLRLQELPAAGAGHLNLHQLRVTPHNATRLARRGYTCLHGAAPTVLESELAVLELLARAGDAGLELPINYCSFVYKDRFQKAAERRRSARAVVRADEGVTARGYVRQLSLAGPADRLDALAARLAAGGAPAGSWVRRGPERVTLALALVGGLTLDGLAASVAYDLPRIVPRVSYRGPFTEVPIGRARKLFVERQALGPALELEPAALTRLAAIVDGRDPGDDAPGGALGVALTRELIPAGLQEYC